MNKLNNPPFLYHYTSIQTLFQLINNLKFEEPQNVQENDLSFYKFCLWGSHISYMNDPSENKLYFNALKEALEWYEMQNNLPPKSPYLQFGKELFEHGNDPYIVSLCDDENSLSMWRCYGSNACGVAIAFSFQKLKKYITDSKVIRLEKIDYKKEDEIIDSFSNEYLNTVYNNITKIKSISTNSSSVGYKLGLSNSLANKIRIKHKAYSDEKEWRLYTFESSPTGYRERNGLIIPYHVFEIPLDTVERIIIGPCAEQKLNKISIEGLFAKKINGINLNERIVVETSNLPYIIR